MYVSLHLYASLPISHSICLTEAHTIRMYPYALLHIYITPYVSLHTSSLHIFSIQLSYSIHLSELHMSHIITSYTSLHMSHSICLTPYFSLQMSHSICPLHMSHILTSYTSLHISSLHILTLYTITPCASLHNTSLHIILPHSTCLTPCMSRHTRSSDVTSLPSRQRKLSVWNAGCLCGVIHRDSIGGVRRPFVIATACIARAPYRDASASGARLSAHRLTHEVQLLCYVCPFVVSTKRSPRRLVDIPRDIASIFVQNGCQRWRSQDWRNTTIHGEYGEWPPWCLFLKLWKMNWGQHTGWGSGTWKM